MILQSRLSECAPDFLLTLSFLWLAALPRSRGRVWTPGGPLPHGDPRELAGVSPGFSVVGFAVPQMSGPYYEKRVTFN
jgi:hypothetical protein